MRKLWEKEEVQCNNGEIMDLLSTRAEEDSMLMAFLASRV